VLRRIRDHFRSNVVAYVALFLALSTGSAVALDGSNTVFSDDIVNGEVENPDLGAKAVNGPKIGTLPATRVSTTADINVPDNTEVTIGFDSEHFDFGAMHNNTTDNSRITASLPGIYQVNAEVEWSDSTTADDFLMYVKKNGTRHGTLDSRSGTDSPLPETFQTASTLVKLMPGDFMEIRVMQWSGGSRTVDGARLTVQFAGALP
jgi:hypothetical protein